MKNKSTISTIGSSWLAGILFLCMANNGIAATSMFVQNDTELEISVDSIDVTGSRLSKKAWKRGETSIPSGNRERVLSVNRTGKFNWMDPTPRFIEPGKTAVFSVALSILDNDENRPIILRLKLLGTGATSKMWYMISGAQTTVDWEFEPGEFNGKWDASANVTIDFSYRAYEENGDTHVEYVFKKM